MRHQALNPGDMLRKVLTQHGISQGEFADAMGVSRLTVNQIINNHRSITADAALRIAKITSTDALYWLKLQQNIDLYNAHIRLDSKIKKIPVLIRRPFLTKYPQTSREEI